MSAHSPASTPKPLVVQTEHLDPAAAAWLAERCRLVVCAHDHADFSSAFSSAEALVIRTYTRIDQGLLDRAPHLKVVGRAGVGLDNVDVAACRRRGVEVVYTPDANTQAVVEYVIALVCDALRPRVTIDQPVDAREWNRLREEIVGRRQINEVVFGILGLGRVGKGVAKAMAGLGARVIYHDLAEIPPGERFGAQPVEVETLFAEAGILSIHIDGRASNRGFVGQRLLSRMKPDVVLINTSRGFVVDNLSLAGFLRDRPDALALLDVHEPEPISAEYPMLGLSNARLYPHLASRTMTAMANMSWVVRDVWTVLQGQPPRFPAPK